MTRSTPAVPAVIVVGSVNVDIVVRAARRPAPGETVLADTLALRPGGKGANQACASARAGAPTRLVAALGTDAYAELLLRGLAAAGVDTAACHAVSGPTGCALITVTPDGENSILVVPGANAETAALLGRGGGAADLVIAGARSAVVTRGSVGAEWAARTGGNGGTADTPLAAGTVLAEPVVPRDSTGAGDAFAGTLGAALARGLTLSDAVREANSAGAAATQWAGAQPWQL